MNLMNDNNGKILETGLERLKSNILIFLFVLIFQHIWEIL